MSDYADFQRTMLEWYAQCVDYDSTQTHRLHRFRNLEPESAQILIQFVFMQQPEKVLEIGTSNGFSTAWLAYALKKVAGHLTTIEIEQKRSALAQHKLAALALDQHVEFIIADAAHFLGTASSDYRLIFLDAERQYYLEYVNDLKRLLTAQAGNTLIVDNVISHAQEVEPFITLFQQDKQFICTTLNIGAGLFVVTFLG